MLGFQKKSLVIDQGLGVFGGVCYGEGREKGRTCILSTYHSLF